MKIMILPRGRDVDEASSQSVPDETLYLAELVAGKVKVNIHEYTRYALIAADRASTVAKLTSGQARRLLYRRYRTFQQYRWWRRYLSTELEHSRAAGNLNKTIYNNREASRTLLREQRRALITILAGETRIQEVSVALPPSEKTSSRCL